MKQMEEEEQKLGNTILEAFNDEEQQDSQKSIVAYNKVKNFIITSSTNEVIDFTVNLTRMAQQLGRDLAIDCIVPNFALLKRNSFKVQIALVEQLYSLASFIIIRPGDKGYKCCVDNMLPLLNECLYDQTQKVRDAAIK